MTALVSDPEVGRGGTYDYGGLPIKNDVTAPLRGHMIVVTYPLHVAPHGWLAPFRSSAAGQQFPQSSLQEHHSNGEPEVELQNPHVEFAVVVYTNPPGLQRPIEGVRTHPKPYGYIPWVATLN